MTLCEGEECEWYQENKLLRNGIEVKKGLDKSMPTKKSMVVGPEADLRLDLSACLLRSAYPYLDTSLISSLSGHRQSIPLAVSLFPLASSFSLLLP